MRLPTDRLIDGDPLTSARESRPTLHGDVVRRVRATDVALYLNRMGDVYLQRGVFYLTRILVVRWSAFDTLLRDLVPQSFGVFPYKALLAKPEISAR